MLRSAATWRRVVVRLDGEPVPALADALIAVLWGDVAPPAAWWRSAIGLVCARHLLADGDLGWVTHDEAAAMLGVARGTVSSWVHRGTLRGGPRGVERAAVLERLVRQG